MTENPRDEALRALREYVDDPGNWSVLDGRRAHILGLIDAALSRPVPDDTAAKVKALNDAAQFFWDRLPDGTGNGRAYNAHQVSGILRGMAHELQNTPAPVVPVTGGVDLEAIEARVRDLPDDVRDWDVVSKDVPALIAALRSRLSPPTREALIGYLFVDSRRSGGPMLSQAESELLADALLARFALSSPETEGEKN